MKIVTGESKESKPQSKLQLKLCSGERRNLNMTMLGVGGRNYTLISVISPKLLMSVHRLSTWRCW